MEDNQMRISDHLYNWELEKAGAASDKAWESWLKQVGIMTEIDNLDGDDSEECADPDGYSLDTCYEWFRKGITPKEAASYIKKRIAELSA